jgi:hypothetical protein
MALNISGDVIGLLFTKRFCLDLVGKLIFGSEINHFTFIQIHSKFNSSKFEKKSSQ